MHSESVDLEWRPKLGISNTLPGDTPAAHSITF